MGEKMSKAPIFLTVGQIRFNPILQMAESINALQERLRKLGYADFARDELKALQVNTAGPTPQIDLLPTSRWRFGNSKKTSEYVLFTDRLVFQTTDYETSEAFMESVLAGIELVHETVQLTYIDGVGVRTLDAVVPEAAKGLQHYLHSQLLGFYGLSVGTLRHNILEGVSVYGDTGQLVSRVVVLNGVLGLPIDLMPMMLVINPRFTQTNGDHAVLDNDCLIQERFDLNVETIRKKLQDAKSGVTEAFYRAVTEEALNQWR